MKVVIQCIGANWAMKYSALKVTDLPENTGKMEYDRLIQLAKPGRPSLRMARKKKRSKAVA